MKRSIALWERLRGELLWESLPSHPSACQPRPPAPCNIPNGLQRWSSPVLYLSQTRGLAEPPPHACPQHSLLLTSKATHSSLDCWPFELMPGSVKAGEHVSSHESVQPEKARLRWDTPQQCHKETFLFFGCWRLCSLWPVPKRFPPAPGAQVPPLSRRGERPWSVPPFLGLLYTHTLLSHTRSPSFSLLS